MMQFIVILTLSLLLLIPVAFLLEKIQLNVKLGKGKVDFRKISDKFKSWFG